MRRTLSIGLPLLLASVPAIANPLDFLNKAMMGDNSEATLGKMAATHAATASVRRYGAMLAADHSKSRREVVSVATRYHVPATTALAPEADAEQHKLAGLDGAAFDREFVRYMVHDHQDDISDFEGELKSGDPAEVRALAKRTLPVLRKHLQAARAIRV